MDWHKLCGVHEGLVDMVFNRLDLQGGYSYLERNVLYSVNGLKGEVDVLAYKAGFDVFHFYEMKSYFDEQLWQRATNQFARFCRAFPERSVRGILVTPTRVIRLRYDSFLQ